MGFSDQTHATSHPVTACCGIGIAVTLHVYSGLVYFRIIFLYVTVSDRVVLIFSVIFVPKIFRNRATTVKIIAGGWVVYFFETQCNIMLHKLSYSNMKASNMDARKMFTLYCASPQHLRTSMLEDCERFGLVTPEF